MFRVRTGSFRLPLRRYCKPQPAWASADDTWKWMGKSPGTGVIRRDGRWQVDSAVLSKWNTHSPQLMVLRCRANLIRMGESPSTSACRIRRSRPPRSWRWTVRSRVRVSRIRSSKTRADPPTRSATVSPRGSCHSSRGHLFSTKHRERAPAARLPSCGRSGRPVLTSTNRRGRTPRTPPSSPVTPCGPAERA